MSPVPRKVRQETIRRLLASRHFAHAESLRKIVTFLFDRVQDGHTGSVREQQIATEALGRPADFDPRIDPIVRVSIGSVRDRIRAYFEGEGRDEVVRVSVPKGEYRLVFENAAPSSASRPGTATACSRFWQPYLSPENPNILVYSELLFFRDPEGNYVRNIYVNDLAGGEGEVRARMNLSPEQPLTPTFHFVSSGEVASLLAITRVFGEIGAPLEHRNARFFNWSDARRANLILLGSARINPFVRSLQGGLPITITPSEIRLSHPRPGEPEAYRGERHREGELERLVEYALITRRSGPVDGTTVTMISANHGRAIEGAGNFLTEEFHLRRLEEAFEKTAVLRHFQLILRVEMLDFDEEVVNVSYVSHRTLPD